jgi:glutamine synthetase
MATTGKIDLPTLRQLVDADEIDTVVVAFTDLLGRLMGKRVTGRFFVDHIVDEDGTGGEGIEACNYLLTVDVDMNVVEGYEYATWDGGYGDFRGRPDLSTLRVTPWLPKTAMVLCDVVEHDGGLVERAHEIGETRVVASRPPQRRLRLLHLCQRVVVTVAQQGARVAERGGNVQRCGP